MRWPWGMSGYQWAVVFAAWLGWGFDIIDALLFNYVAENCIPTLLKLRLGSPEAAQATKEYVGFLTSVLLVGWAVGGIFFGWLADRIGRAKTLFITIVLYSLGTALCAAAPNTAILTLCRLLSSLGIGGEWAAGAAMVAEVVPKQRRVEAGALLYTSAPVGLICAAFINKFVAGWWLPDHPEYSWRVVFLFGLLPAAAAAVMRMFLKEPEGFQAGNKPSLRELFTPEFYPLTRSGLLMAITALLGWWTLNSFMPLYIGGLAQAKATAMGLNTNASALFVADWKLRATALFSIGGFIGTLLTVPFANRYGRKVMFASYFSAAVVAVFVTYSEWTSPEAKVLLQGAIGLTIFGVFGSFTYYLPELFPARLRATGSGFCYNIGRVITAFGPYLIGEVSKGGLASIQSALFWVFLVPLFGLCALPWVIETKDLDSN